MDIDVMRMQLRGLMEFKAKVERLFPHGKIPEPSDEDLARRQAMVDPDEVETGHRPTVMASAELLNRVNHALELGTRLETLLPILEKVIEDVEDMKQHHTEMADGLSALQQADGKEAAPSQEPAAEAGAVGAAGA